MNQPTARAGRDFTSSLCDHNLLSATGRLVQGSAQPASRLSALIRALCLASLALAFEAQANTFYSQGSLDPALTASWDSVRGGGGGPPANFTSGDTFVIQNTHSMTTASAWTVSGTGATIQIENGGTLMANNLVAVPAFQVDNGGTYVHNAASAASNGAAADVPGSTSRTFGAASTIEFQKWAKGGAAPVALPSPVTWGNLKINVVSLGGDWNQNGTLTLVAGNLIVQQTGGTHDFVLVATSPATTTLNVTGGIQVSGGTLVFSSSSSVPTVNVSGDVSVSGGALSALSTGGPVFNIAGAVNLTGGVMTLQADFGTAPSSITLNGGTLRANTAMTFPPARVITVGANSGGINSAAASSPFTLSNNITGSGSVTQTSGGLNLWGTNSFQGDFILAGSTGNNPSARFNSDYAAGTGKVIVSPKASTVVTTIRNTGVVRSTLTNEVVFNSGGSTIALDTDVGNTFVASGNFSGAGPVTRGGNGGTGGTVMLLGDNYAWNGGLLLARGTTALGHKRALGSGTLTISPPAATPAAVILQASTPLTGANAVTNPVVLAITNIYQFTIGGTNALELSGPITLANSTPTITNNNTAATILSGIISGSPGLGLTVSGSGTLTLSGANTYEGTTTVDGGTLVVNGSLASANVVVNASATLGGGGTIGGAVTVNGGGKIGAGSSAGLLTLANGLNLSAGGTNVWELAANSTATPGTAFDQISLTGGNLALGGSSTLRIQFTGAATFPDAANAFWQSAHNWTVIALGGTAGNAGNSNFGAIAGTNGVTAGTFATVVSNGSIVLTYTPAGQSPQPLITGVTMGAGTLNAVITWSALNHVTYDVEYKNDLNALTWTLLGTVTASGSTASITDTNNPLPPIRFYRVVAP